MNKTEKILRKNRRNGRQWCYIPLCNESE